MDKLHRRRWRVILKWILGKEDGVVRIEFLCPRRGNTGSL
jgi:hypothetical protein